MLFTAKISIKWVWFEGSKGVVLKILHALHAQYFLAPLFKNIFLRHCYVHLHLSHSRVVCSWKLWLLGDYKTHIHVYKHIPSNYRSITYRHRLKGGRGIGNGRYRCVSLFCSFAVPLRNLVCNIIIWINFFNVPTWLRNGTAWFRKLK